MSKDKVKMSGSGHLALIYKAKLFREDLLRAHESSGHWLVTLTLIEVTNSKTWMLHTHLQIAQFQDEYPRTLLPI